MKATEQNTNKESSFIQKLIYFFPLQLFFVHIKKNQQLLLFWALLFLIIFKQVGTKYGLPLLFLAPEYIGGLSFSSYFILGFAIGGFAMAFNISSYIMNGFRFPFLATLSKPFLKYCLNNALIPFIFIISYLFQAYEFLSDYEDFTLNEIIHRLAGFVGGYFIFVFLTMVYFMATNKDLEELFGKELAKVMSSDTKKGEPAKDLLSRSKAEWYKEQALQSKIWRVDYYFGQFFRLRKTRPYDHYKQHMLTQVFRQNHINASRFEIAIIISIIILGLFRENEIFIIPAASTITLLFTMLLMITSALRSWLHGWTWVVIAAVLLGINLLTQYTNFYYESRAYGLSYAEKAKYPQNAILTDSIINADINEHLKMLNNWELKNKNHPVKKPKAVFVAASGGGSRAVLWSFVALQHLDSLTNGELFKHSVLFTGSSGGMIGSAFFRELKLSAKSDSLSPYAAKYQEAMSKDILNPVIFTLAVNDMLVRTQRFNYQGGSYWKDRAYIFEKTLNNYTEGLMDKKLLDYKAAEQNADIPLMILSPSIVNDSRRLLISNLPLSFMAKQQINTNALSENVDFQQLFNQHNPLQIRFLSALRMSASFPYILTTVNLPTDPMIEVFDAGLRDNYGIKTITKYIFNLRQWLERNTSGIVILQIRDGLKTERKYKKTEKRSMLKNLLSPFGSLYGNWFEVQDYNNDELLEYASAWYSGEVEIIDYQLNRGNEEYISLSWHLTSKEKKQILSSINLKANQKAEKQLIEHLNYDQ